MREEPVKINAVLEENLRAYYARYPEDFERLAKIATKEVSPDFELPSYSPSDPVKDYPPRVCILLGIFDIPAFLAIKDRFKSDSYFIIEMDADVIAYQFQTQNLAPLILANGVYLFLGHDKYSVIAPMQRFMRQSYLASRIKLSQIVCHDLNDPKMKPENKEFYTNFIPLYMKTVEHVFFNFGNLFDSLEGVRATLANSDFIANCEGIDVIENLHKGKNFVVVGAGPSLDADLPLLKENQDKFIIVAVDAAAKVLESAGIRYDYVTSIERFNVMQDKFFRDLKPSKAELVAYPVVHTEVLKLWPNKIRIVYRNYAWFAYFEKNWPKGILESGGSASHLATKLAFFLGADTVFLLGCDMSYEQVEDKFRSHCQSTAYPEWAHLKTQEEMDRNPDFGPSYLVEANDGTMIRTNQVYHQWAKEYASISLSMNLGLRLGSCSAKGVKIAGVEYVNFAEVCKTASVSDHIANPPTTSTVHGEVRADLGKPLSHTKLLENLKGYLKHCQTAFDILYKSNEHPITEEMFVICYKLFYEKIAFETLFTAFVIQNCASEFFIAETILNSLNREDPLPKKAGALAGLYKVLSNTLSYTVELFEEAEQGKVRDKVLP